MRPVFAWHPAQCDQERFSVVVWWSVVILLVSSVFCGARHAKTLIVTWLAVYITLAAVYVAIFTTVPFKGIPPITRRNFERDSEPQRDVDEHMFEAMPIADVQSKLPDYDSLVHKELMHRIEYGHYSDNPVPENVRPRWGGRGDIPGVLGGVW